MKPPLTRAELGVCTRVGCTCGSDGAPTIELRQKCHPGIGLDVRFVRATGAVELRCPCGREIAQIAVAGELVAGKEN